MSAVRSQIPGLPFWFHDLGSCLHDCFGTVLRYHERDPIEVLGASWAFQHDLRDIRADEFYYPAIGPSLGDSMFPFHPIEAVWRSAPDFTEAWADIRKTLADGRPVIAAVDNFFMPIRPAFGDVHASHLVILSGYDDERAEVQVLENTPPLFHGAIPLADFERARSSQNTARTATRDYFFAGSPIENRWIDVRVGEQFPALSRDFVEHVVRTNGDAFRAGPPPGGALRGLDGLATFLHQSMVDGAGLAAIYAAGWTAQSEAALHADFLRLAGRRLHWDELAEAGRVVDRLANDWTAVRVTAAHVSTGAAEAGDELIARIGRLVADYERALEELDLVVFRGPPATLGRPAGR